MLNKKKSRGCLGIFVGVVGVAGRALQPFLPFPKQITVSKPIFVCIRLGLCKLSILLLLNRLRGIFTFLCFPKKKIIVESPGPNNFASETGTIALSLIFVHSAIVVIRAQQLQPHLSCHFSAAETGAIALSSTLVRPCFGHCQHHTARDGTTRGPQKKKNSQGVDPRTSPKRAWYRSHKLAINVFVSLDSFESLFRGTLPTSTLYRLHLL